MGSLDAPDAYPSHRLRSLALDLITIHLSPSGLDSCGGLALRTQAGAPLGSCDPEARAKPRWTTQICGLVVLNANKNHPKRATRPKPF